jgi:methylmalonyl-CoA mutase C-terminal domain/subunit
MVRVLISKPGLDGHDRGAKVVARAFEEAGADVVYTGLHSTPDEIADIVEHESIDVVGVSLLSGAHNTLMPRIIDKVKGKGITDVVYVVGGIIPQDDIPNLKALGVHGVFGPGTPLEDMTEFAFEQVAVIKMEKLIDEKGPEMGEKRSNL